LAFLLAFAAPLPAQDRSPVKLPVAPAALKNALPYVQAVHQILDSVTSRDSATTINVKQELSEPRSEWIVHRVKARVWVERTSSNYLGEIDVRVTIPCYIEFGFDLSQLKRENMRYDAARKLLIVDLPPVYIRDPIPLLADMKIEPKYKGLRNVVLDTESMQALQATVLKQDYQPAAKEVGMTELSKAQIRARDMMQDYLQNIFRQAGSDVEVIVR
jgi:hypothetical protein